MKALILWASIVIFFSTAPGSNAISLVPDPEATIQATLGEGLKAHFRTLAQQELPAYYVAYRLHDTLSLSFACNLGAVISKQSRTSRFLDTEVRVGKYAFDNTHPLREQIELGSLGGFRNMLVPIQNGIPSLRHAMKIGAEYAYREATERYRKVQANVSMRPTQTDSSPDFTSAPGRRISDTTQWTTPDSVAIRRLQEQLLQVSRRLKREPLVYSSTLYFDFKRVRKRVFDSEGLRLTLGEEFGTVGIRVETKASDGEILWLSYDFNQRSFPSLTTDTLQFALEETLRKLHQLRKAPAMETFSGPVILKNRAAAVFIHEVLGHRVEGHRQKAVEEGQTFVHKVGLPVTQLGITVFDDPTLKRWGGVDLNGHYAFDDEGIASTKVDLIQNGVFRGFLLSRSVLGHGQQSNGHGRGELGHAITSRMGSTVLQTDQPVPASTLRSKLIALLRQKNLPSGLVIHDISGGFTYTTRDLPQTFKLQPLYVVQVFADGREDQVVRGVDAVGTPLESLRRIFAVGDDAAIFNGYCGAESGWVPVSAVSPSLLLESMEFETKAKDQNLPPFLPPPGTEQ